MASNLKIEKIASEGNYAKYEIFPFERGFGNTFATPLRRVLYSSIKGASVTSVKFKGVAHEFSTIKGVKEDVLKIINNLQKVVFRLNDSEKETIVLKAKGAKVLTASNIKVPGNVEIATPDLEIAEITADDGEIELEAIVESGFGFQMADQEIRNSMPGTIPLNRSFSPIDKVNVAIESTRVAQKTDYEKVVIEIWTNGSVNPDEAIKQAVDQYLAKLQELHEVITNFDGSLVQDKEVEEDEKAK